jgi:hypothetical protein
MLFIETISPLLLVVHTSVGDDPSIIFTVVENPREDIVIPSAGFVQLKIYSLPPY